MKKQFFLAIALSGLAQFAVAEPYQIESEGVVQEVDLANSTVTITGYGYEVDPGARIRVAGNVSSVAALDEGMKVRFVYKVYEGLDAQIQATADRQVLIEVEQLPDSTVVELF